MFAPLKMLIYLATNLVNGKLYIGKTILTLERRKNQHLADSRKPKMYFHRALQKYGCVSFEFQELQRASSNEQLNNLERLWIILLRSSEKVFGYNVSIGGEGVVNWEEEARKRQSEITKLKMDRPEVFEKMSRALRGKVIPIERRLRIGRTLKGRKLTEEHCRNIGLGNRRKAPGKKGGAKFGHFVSEQTKQRLSEAAKRQWDRYRAAKAAKTA